LSGFYSGFAGVFYFSGLLAALSHFTKKLIMPAFWFAFLKLCLNTCKINLAQKHQVLNYSLDFELQVVICH